MADVIERKGSDEPIPLLGKLLLLVGEDEIKAISALKWTVEKIIKDSRINYKMMIVQIRKDFELNDVTNRRYELTDFQHLSLPQLKTVDLLNRMLSFCYDNQIPSNAWVNSGAALDILVKEEQPNLLVFEKCLMLQLNVSDNILPVSQFKDDAHCPVFVGELGDISHIPENSPQAPAPVQSSEDMCLDSNIMKDIAFHDYTTPTSIQAQGIPLALSGRDLLGCAETGSGKMAASTIPMIQHSLAQSHVRRDDGPLALVLAPTRELDPQIEKKKKMVEDEEGETPHVLVVDDDSLDRKVAEKLLTKSSCKVTTAENGPRALELLDRNNMGSKIKMIITDYNMPGMTGYDLLKKVKESSDFKEIPVVIVSSENDQTIIEKCLEEGAQDFIIKPLKLEVVKKLIKTTA